MYDGVPRASGAEFRASAEKVLSLDSRGERRETLAALDDFRNWLIRDAA